MKRKFLFGAIAASLAFTGCSNEEFMYEGNDAVRDDMVSVEGLNLAFTRTSDDAQTKAVWAEKEKGGLAFAWDASTDAIGMVYTGQTGTVGLTNYKFTVDSLYNENLVVPESAPTGVTTWYTTKFQSITQTSYDASSDWGKSYTKYMDGETEKTMDANGLVSSSASAKFETENDEIMKGYYVAYYPHNSAYTEAGGSIPVVSPKRITVNSSTTNLQAVGDVTFSYAAPTLVKAGRQVTNFALKNLSSVLRIKIANEGELTAEKKIKSVILRTRGEDAFVVKGTLTNPALAPAASVIKVDETDGKTATLFVDYEEGSELSLAASKKAENKDTVSVYFPVLPTTLAETGVDVIVIGSDNMACVLTPNFKSAGVTLPAGTLLNLNAKITKDTKFDQSFVTNAKDLKAAISATKTQTSPTSINLLGDIEANALEMEGVSENDWKGGVTITASAGSKLKLTNPVINLYNSADAAKESFLAINAPVTINGATILGTVKLNGTTDIEGTVNIGHVTHPNFYYGKLEIGGATTVKKDAVINSVYSWGVTVNQGATLTIAEGATFNNKNWDFDSTVDNDRQYKSDLIIKGSMVVDGKLVDAGDTQIIGGTLTINGEASNNNTVNVSENGSIIVNGVYKNLPLNDASGLLEKAGNVKVVTGALTVNAGGKIYNRASLNCMGSFTNGGTFYDYVGSVYGGVPYTSDGTYACYVNSAKRLEEAYTRLNIYAKGKTQTIILQPLTPATDAYKFEKAKAAGINFETEGNINIAAVKTDATNGNTPSYINSLKVNAGNTVVVGGDLMIAGTGVTPLVVAGEIEEPATAAATITFNNDIVVKINGAIANEGWFNLLSLNTGNLPASVYCKSADVTKGTWTNYPLVIADGSFWNE